MATVTFYSDSEEFLQGLQVGMDYLNEGAVSVFYVKPSNKAGYRYMLAVEDKDVQEPSDRFYNGYRFDCEVPA